MNLIIDNRLREKYKGLERKPEDISEITIHGTGGGTARGIIEWMTSDACERAELYKKGIGLFPYMIDRNGTIYEIMPPVDWYYHSEAGAYDKHTIGIELVNDKINNAGDYTEHQYESLFKLIQLLCGTYAIKKITSHDTNRRIYSGLGSKPCPGDKFSKAAIEAFQKIYNFEWTINI